MSIHNHILDLIGHTPLVRLNKVVPAGSAEILAKLESFNPGGSVKDRIALHMIDAAEKAGRLQPGATIVEASSGNTGIGLAMVCAVRGYHLILTMPETMSDERRKILEAYGAEVVLTRPGDGMTGAVEKAEELTRATPGSLMVRQFQNPSNPDIHRKTTAEEILTDTNGTLDAFVACVGTGGTISGVGELLKKKIPNVQIVAVEPETSAVLSGEAPGPHLIQGIGAGFIPDVLNRKVIDRIIKVNEQKAFQLFQRLAKEEGVLAGLSSGAVLIAALEIARELGAGKRVVTIFPDSGERYFSAQEYF